MTLPRIVFMGTPPFAVVTLDALVRAGVEVAAVVTAPDKPAGRGRQLRMSAVKERALALGLPVLQPEKLKDPAFHAQLDATGADLYIVVAFRMLPEAVWARPTRGTINLHGSLLPQYRGAAPINWAVINGERTTGLTTFFIQQEIDTGDLLLSTDLPIGAEETAGELHDRMMMEGGELIVRTVQDLAHGDLHPKPQTVDAHGLLRAAPKLTPDNCRIVPARPAQQVHDHIRGLSPFPGAWAEWKEGDRPALHFKVLRARQLDTRTDHAPGTVLVEGRRLVLQCADGRLELMEVQLEGKKRMPAEELLNGLRPTGSIILG